LTRYLLNRFYLDLVKENQKELYLSLRGHVSARGNLYIIQLNTGIDNMCYNT